MWLQIPNKCFIHSPAEMMCIELKFHFGIIKPTEELLDSRILAIIWIISHILTEDRKYGPYLNDKGVP